MGRLSGIVSMLGYTVTIACLLVVCLTDQHTFFVTHLKNLFTFKYHDNQLLAQT